MDKGVLPCWICLAKKSELGNKDNTMQTEKDDINKQILRYEMINYLHTHPEIKNELIDFSLIVLKMYHAFEKQKDLKAF